MDYESDSREPPGRVDATNVLPPWPEVERHLYPGRKKENPIGGIALESGLVIDLDSQSCESGMSKPPGRVDATIVLPPWPEVKGKGAGEKF